MGRNVIAVVALVVISAALFAGTVTRKAIKSPILDEPTVISRGPVGPPPKVDFSRSSALIGTYTTLSTRYDFQNNGGASQYIRVNPANGNIHVIMMTGDDSTDVTGGASRGTGYAFSSDGGVTWNNFSAMRVPPDRRSGYPSLDLLQGPAGQGIPVIANHNVPPGGSTNSVFSYVDSPEGAGMFVELNALPTLNPPVTGGEPIWPMIAGASDGSIVIHASVNNGGLGPQEINRSADLVSWLDPWVPYPGVNSGGGRYSTQANGSGRVGIMNNNADVINWLESTDNGATWPATPVEIYPSIRIVGSETLAVGLTQDFVYNGNNALMAINTTRTDGTNLLFAGSRIEFWSAPTGFVDAAPWDSTRYLSQMVAQVFHLSMGYPSIGISGSRVVIVYMAFQPDTSGGFNYGDIYLVQSGNGGLTWNAPINLTNTPNLDERYPSVSKWNEPGKANIVWQEDTAPGSWVRGEGPNTRAKQVFLKLTLPALSGVEEHGGGVATGFKLSQNYPNPFNPSTKIDYGVSKAGSVSIKVFNTLGEEVATILDQQLSPGQYSVNFNANSLPSGVYVYRLQASGFTESKKMLLLK